MDRTSIQPRGSLRRILRATLRPDGERRQWSRTGIRTAALAVAALGVVVACRDVSAPTVARPTSPVSTAVAATETRLPMVVFLPPLGTAAPDAGDGDTTLLPAVEVCRVSGSSCADGPPLARFETVHHGGAAEGDVLSLDADSRTYRAVWNTDRAILDAATIYRVRVLLVGMELGHIDVRPTTTGGKPAPAGVAATTDGTVRFEAGRALPIAFRLVVPRRLVIIRARGVEGGPSVLDTTVAAGSRTRYHFAASAGYQNVLVTLDGEMVGSSGQVVADTDHVLYATADRRVELPAGTEPVYDAARAVLTATDPVDAFQHYLDVSADYLKTVDVEVGIARLRDVDFLAFDPIRDSAAIRRVDIALGGHSFAVGRSTTAAAASSGMRATRRTLGRSRWPATAGTSLAPAVLADVASADIESGGGEPEATTFVYVNGIWTPWTTGHITSTRLYFLKHEVPELADDGTFDMQFFYNETHDAAPSTVGEREAHCEMLFEVRAQDGFLGDNSRREFMASCMGDTSYRAWTSADLLECVRQVARILAGADGVEVDGSRLADYVNTLRSAGQHVIVLPHSQGNLITIEAIKLARQRSQYDPARDSACLGAVAMASPSSSGWLLPDHYLAQVSVRHDLVVDLGFNDWPRLDTDSSEAASSFLLIFGDLWSPLASFRLHLVNSSYLGTPQSREAIKTGMLNVYHACALKSVYVTPPAATLKKGQGAQFFALLSNVYGDRLYGRKVKWTSDAPAVASVDTAGFVLASATGYAVLTAESRSRRAAVGVTVLSEPPKPTIDIATASQRPVSVLALGDGAPDGYQPVYIPVDWDGYSSCWDHQPWIGGYQYFQQCHWEFTITLAATPSQGASRIVYYRWKWPNERNFHDGLYAGTFQPTWVYYLAEQPWPWSVSIRVIDDLGRSRDTTISVSRGQ
jgi:hypothetical protein